MTREWMTAVADHLWQSTVFGLCAMALSLALRRASGRVRFGLWLAASLKFLLPFALLETIGERLAPAAKAASSGLRPGGMYRMDVMDKPFTFSTLLVPPSMAQVKAHAALHLLNLLPELLLVVWVAGVLVFAARWWMQRRRLQVLVAAARPAAETHEVVTAIQAVGPALRSRHVDVLVSEHALEPGIFGVFRSKLVWPSGLSEKLTSGEVETIVAHELCHVSRRDNLTMALHMLVQTLFWFHPLVWWLRARLIDEREHACDEAVVAHGFASEVYAAGILRACEFCLEAPAACVAGVAGSDLAERISRIAGERAVRGATRAGRFVLAVFMTAALMAPVLLGRFNTPTVHAALMPEQDAKAQFAFEVVTIKLSSPNANGRSLMMNQARFETHNLPLFEVIQFAYDARSASQIAAVPDWVKNEHFDIQAKEDAATAEALRNLPPDEYVKQVRLMVQALLVERCHLKIVRERGERPVYALVVAKGGSRMKPTATPPLSELHTMKDAEKQMRGIRMSDKGELTATDASAEMLANLLGRMPEAEGRPVIDKTGLTGGYDWTLKWTPETLGSGPAAGNPDTSGPTLFTALQEQLGLKLEPQKGSVEIVRIDSIECPSEN